MDVESDGSERWEDFFGSSTDIGPSVLGYLDTLANNFNEEAKQLVESSNNKPLPTPAGVLPLKRVAHVFQVQHESTAVVLTNGSAVQQRDCTASSDTFPSPLRPTAVPAATSSSELITGSFRKISDKFFNLVSPNVQRMVSNRADPSSSALGDSAAGNFVRNNAQSASFSSVPIRKPARATATSPPLVSHKNLPLSKNIAKLTHTSSELIDHFVDKPSTINRRPKHSAKVRANGSTAHAMDLLPAGSTAETNGNHATEEKTQSSMEDLQDVSALQRQIRSLTVDLERNEDANVPTSVLPDNDDGNVMLRTQTGHDAFEDAFVGNCADLSEHRNTVVEACNPYPNVGRCITIDRRNDPAGPDEHRRSLADARAKLLDANGNRKISVPDSPKLSLRSGTENSTSTSTPSLNTTTSGSPYSSKASLLIPPNTPRPLSVSSLCSYSSSTSSSGSEHNLPGGKCSAAGSYQASVESLADHSESEPVSVIRHACHGEINEGLAVAFCTGMTMCERAVREIIDSESSYVKDLGQVIRGYLEDWKERACLKHDQLKILFSNIQEIYDFNCKLLHRLREAKGDPVAISNCFIDLHAEFSCYTTYCTSYPEAISLLTALLQATHTNALLVRTQKLLEHTLPLGSYLLKPVQRILKYHLLLDNLRKHCSDKHVAQAHQLMKNVAHNIDQVKTKLDQARLVKELAGILDGWLGPDLSVLGDLLHEGRLMEHAKPRIVLLFQTMLIVAKPKEDKRLQFRAYIPCKNLMLVEHLPGEQTSFNVIPFDDPKGVLKLTARNREEKRLWTQQIKQAMLQHYSDIPKRAMELVLQLGDEDERFTDKPYWKRPTNNSPVPEYLERRQQFRRSEMRNRSKKNLLKKDTPPAAVNGLTVPSFRSYSNDLEHCPMGHRHNSEECKCDAVKRQLQQEIKPRPGGDVSLSSPPKPFRSRSETRCGPVDDEEERLLKSLYERRKLSAPSKRGTKVKESFASIRSYNSTMIPKRISEMRKRRPKTATSSSTFYTDLGVSSEATVTDHETTIEPTFDESSTDKRKTITNDDASRKTEHKKMLPVKRCVSADTSVADGCVEHMKDSEIISKLVLDAEIFNKVLNKPLTKKKSFDASSRPSALVNVVKKPEPPNTEPPCEDEDVKLISSDGASISCPCDDQTHEVEPIYESLLRNVHVPYKYAPSSLARHSLPCVEGNKTLSIPGGKPSIDVAQSAQTVGKDPLTRKFRPESDYVTLAYSEIGLLEGISAHEGMGLLVGRSNTPHKTRQPFRNSDTNISYHRENSVPVKESDEQEVAAHDKIPDEEPMVLKQSFLERQGSLSMKTTAQKSILQRFISLHPSSGTAGSEGNLLQPLQRKISAPSSGSSIGHIYKQGSVDLGSRIAHLDYADPKTLFLPSPINGAVPASNGNRNVLINRASMQSISLASDQQRDSVLASSSSSDSMCEDPSKSPGESHHNGDYVIDDDDDNCCFYERTVEECLEHDFRDSAVYSGDDNDRQRIIGLGEPEQHLYEPLSPVPMARTHRPQRNNGPPPPIPIKPAHLVRTKSQPATGETKPANHRGWVLQQVHRFQ